ncbi:erg26, C-3 sterol dehydrogenase [Lecanora helva]
MFLPYFAASRYTIQLIVLAALAVACRDSDVQNVKALIVGPHDTPYEFGFFEFSVKFPEEYPAKPPTVTAKTTNGGRCRFNPNIYAGGKVCLSILGTWRGESGEQWSSAQGLESILISIQSLMSSNPYENEPGFENATSTEDKKAQAQYVAKIRHETLRISVIQRLEDYLNIHSDGTVDEFPALEEWGEPRTEYDVEPTPPPFEPFKDLCKRRFLWYYDAYLQSITEAEKTVKPNQNFAAMPFEGGGNSMLGKFFYPELRRRLALIHTCLFRELDYWAKEGAMEVRKDTTTASMVERQFQQIVETYKKNDAVTLDIELVDRNPFVWHLTYFGRPMTNLDGGMFKIKMTISIRFPDEQPRVIFETKMFHHRISKEGVLCYFPRRPDELKSHIESIIEAIEDIEPPYDPRTLVHPEASKLYWGSADDKKQYSRQLRRSVQRSME